MINNKFTNKNMTLNYSVEDGHFTQNSLNTSEYEPDTNRLFGFPTFSLAITGVPFGNFSNQSVGYSVLPQEMKLISCEKQGNNNILTYFHEKYNIRVESVITEIPSSNMFRQVNRITNCSQENLGVRHFSAAFVTGIASGGYRDWQDKKKIKVHYSHNTWEGEAQWRSSNLEDLGVFHTSNNPCNCSFNISSIGTWTTGTYLPMLLVENRETGKIWYFQMESGSSWHMSLGYRSNWSNTRGSLYVEADSADERRTNFYKELLPGECYETEGCAYGCCLGGINEAIIELTKYRRYIYNKKPKSGIYPLVFNDYMNCLWADPTPEKLIPLIDRAGEVGAEYFCIDSGWFVDIGSTWIMGLGDWNPNENRFKPYGLQGIFDYIQAKGMKPGIWFEMEVCGEDSELYSNDDSWFLMRHGKRVGGHSRCFLNFTNPHVCNHLRDKIEFLYNMGLRFIKNDYNDCVGIGDDSANTEFAANLQRNTDAFYAFVDDITNQFDDLIIEGCSSGAMRQDGKTLKHFHLQSSSDQEFYDKYPSIITGDSLVLLPEHCGIWSYPYPLLGKNKLINGFLDSDEYKRAMADGEQTIFNLISGFCGNLYLSGRIDKADELNISLIKEGIELYKSQRSFIHQGYGYLPKNFTRFNDDDSAAYAITNEDKSRILLAVWRLNQNNPCIDMDFKELAGRNITIKQLYPSGNEYHADYSFNKFIGRMTVRIEKKYSARYFEITKTK